MSHDPSDPPAADLRTDREEAPREAPARPAAKGEHYWFVFDRWLRAAARPEDEFVLA